MIPTTLTADRLPTHVAIIMDGNGRWAVGRGMPRSAGHVAGTQTFRKIARRASDIGIRYLTLYVFSTENWSRPPEEVDGLMALFENYLGEAVRDFEKENMAVSFFGDRSRFSPKISRLMERIEANNVGKTGMRLNLAVNYGGKDELVRAVRLACADCLEGKLSADSIDAEKFSEYLYSAGQPDVDLLIRTGGDKRISNFLLWQIAYAEITVIDKYWPDFTTDDFDSAVADYALRERRFGKVGQGLK